MVSVFGLDVESEAPLPFLAGASAGPTGRRLELSLQAADAAALDWPRSARLVCDERQPNGEAIFSIEAHSEAGFLISGPEYGAFQLSADGRRLQCAPGAVPRDAWQRLLIAQVLPFAAVLHGLEVLHASAVVTDRGAVACIGPSGTGKTSLALELCRRGAAFLADDVLALELAEESLLAHPGAPVAGLDHAEAARLADTDGAPRYVVLARNARERIVRMSGAAAPAPLVALFFLDRRDDVPGEPRFEPTADPQLLLAATFNTVLTPPARLRGLLEVCARVARGRVERVAIGPGVDAAQLAAAITQRLGGAR
jgi:hypothetical protein